MPLLSKLATLARSPQGRRLAQQAMRYANSPQGKAKIAAARQRVARQGTRPRPR